MSRFATPDALSGTLMRVINPQRWNTYAYTMNNPVAYVDPDGRDAAAVNFSGMVGGLGHEGLLVVSKDGSATYARFGPEDHSLANAGGLSAPGVAASYNNIPKVEFGSNGLPTDASMQAVVNAVAQDEGVDPHTVRINYFRTSSADTAVLNGWIADETQNGGHSEWYCVFSRNCATFTAKGLFIGGAITREQENNLSIDPNLMFLQLQRLANSSYWFDLLSSEWKRPEACVTTYAEDGPFTTCEN